MKGTSSKTEFKAVSDEITWSCKNANSGEGNCQGASRMPEAWNTIVWPFWCMCFNVQSRAYIHRLSVVPVLFGGDGMWMHGCARYLFSCDIKLCTYIGIAALINVRRDSIAHNWPLSRLRHGASLPINWRLALANPSSFRGIFTLSPLGRHLHLCAT